MVAAAERNLWHRVIGGHLSPDGHRVAAEVLVARLRAGGFPAASPASAVAPPLPDVSLPRP
ncbi:hypothetical protein D3C83_243110 [compost metagenome]